MLIGGEQTPEGLAAIATLSSVYAEWVPQDKIITTNLWSSELSKLVANAFLAQRVSSINSITARQIVQRMFNTITGKRIAVLGFAFKKDTGDTRESAACYVMRDLLEERAVMAVYDPQVTREQMVLEFQYCCNVSPASFPSFDQHILTESSAIDACRGAHAIAVLTEWDEFVTLPFREIYDVMSKPAFIFDGRNILPHKALREIGFEVYAIGKPVPKEKFV